MNSQLNLLFIGIVFTLLSCTDDSNPNQQQPEENVIEIVNNIFPFVPNQNFEALYLCTRRNSNLAWYFNFHVDGSLDVLFTTDTNDDFLFRGTYTYVNDVITMRMDAGPTMPFPNGLNESSTIIMPQFGLVAAFATNDMIAICIGHGLNTQPPPRINANYGCPIINVQVASYEQNAIELVHSAVPGEFPVAGSIFRQQDTNVSGSENPLIRRGFGIYRQSGNNFYATFQIAADFADFAADQLPLNVGMVEPPFRDFNIISGRISQNGRELFVNQLSPEEGPCVLR